MKVIFLGEPYECLKAECTETTATLTLTDGGKVEFIGVSDFSVFEIEGGEWETEETTPTQLDAIEAQVTYTAMMTDTLLEV